MEVASSRLWAPDVTLIFDTPKNSVRPSKTVTKGLSWDYKISFGALNSKCVTSTVKESSGRGLGSALQKVT